MASATIGNAIATGADVPGVDLQRPYTVKKAKLDSPPASRDANGSATTGAGVGTDSEQERAKKRMLKKKYRHTFAIHSQSRTSCLSYEGNESPHFWGFKNLMMLVLSECPPQTTGQHGRQKCQSYRWKEFADARRG